ncbi:hypothetical protein ACIQOV_38900, partial [Kitasatospora sp. NPDC091257]|uniref:hypothetical protein n=1 Tax=Kitasatospora sp. NPDC091257 TaxID=3364084 RepID=UPI0037FA3DBC
GAVSGFLPAMLAGWGLGYLSRQISDLMRKFVMGLGKWQETKSELWLFGSLGFLLVLVVVSLIPTDGKGGKGGKKA